MMLVLFIAAVALLSLAFAPDLSLTDERRVKDGSSRWNEAWCRIALISKLPPGIGREYRSGS
jgi:hypothetical protein